jgi:signal transduction histidine kinase
LRQIPADRRVIRAESMRDPRTRFTLAAEPAVTEPTSPGAAARIARAISEQLDGAEVRARTREAEIMVRHRHPAHRRGPGGGRLMPSPDEPGPPGPLMRVTELAVSARLDAAHWLNARLYLPLPRPPPVGALWGALLSVFAVGIGAALVSRQIGRPLAQLADAAQALGAGQTNVSAPVRGPHDVRRAASAFNAMAERLGRQLNRQRQMLWALSHDLRTPITAIRLRAELIEDEAARQRLLASVAEMEQLTEQALALARAGASEEPRREVDLAEIAHTLAGELRDMGMSIGAEADAPVLATCRPSEIARALRNLAENAVKHANGGVMRAYRNAQGEAVLDVIDEGPGVSESQLARLADPFYRADSARAQTNGAGLGLAIAQAIAEAHGGRLELKNREIRGFSAALILP